MPETQTGVRVELAHEGSANVATGLPVLDHLVGQLARAARFKLALEVAPGSADEEMAAAGRGLGPFSGAPPHRPAHRSRDVVRQLPADSRVWRCSAINPAGYWTGIE